MAAFLDTNILVYAFADRTAGSARKADQAKQLIDSLISRHELIVSAQVLSEFSVNAMRKATPPLAIGEISLIAERLSKQTVIPVDASLIQLALHRVQQSRLSYWDALIVEAALRARATILYTEDMHHGTRYDSLELRNPFLAA